MVFNHFPSQDTNYIHLCRYTVHSSQSRAIAALSRCHVALRRLAATRMGVATNRNSSWMKSRFRGHELFQQLKTLYCPQYSAFTAFRTPTQPFFLLALHLHSVTSVWQQASGGGDQCPAASLWWWQPVPTTQTPRPDSSLSCSLSFLHFSSVIFIFIPFFFFFSFSFFEFYSFFSQRPSATHLFNDSFICLVFFHSLL